MPSPATLESLCKTYLTQFRDQRKVASSTGELSYREGLGQFLRESAAALGKNVDFTHEAKRLAVGRPDYEVKDGLKVIGYVEAEHVGADLNNLKGHAKTQNERFRQNLHCVLLTNHLDWQVWIDNKLVESMHFAEPPAQGSVSVGRTYVDEWEKVIGRFLNESVPQAHSAEDVARQLAKRAKELKFAAEGLLAEENSALEPFYNAYEQTLFKDLPKKKFGDIYAQTFTYGLFLAWLSHDKGAFTPSNALREIPQSVPPIKVLLDFGGGSHLPDEFEWVINGICSDLNGADREAALKPFADGRDPIMHFYETFLAAYDPKLRESRGVYYTPDSVVEFIVRAVDDLLQTEFSKTDGLADPTVTLLDPAVGTATFLAHAYRHVHATMIAGNQGGKWPARAEEHVARHFFGFELLPAAYTLAHTKLRSLLMELKAPLPDKVRLPVYLTNTLDEGIAADVSLPFLDVLSKEAMSAKEIKNRDAVLVVLGNPPYSGHSANPSKNEKGEFTYIGKLVNDYFYSDGAKLGERNPKWLQDDYVKFLRFAENRIEKTGQGIVAFITNHGYLDNPTFRGMRRHLMNTFDKIYVYDLHGNANKKERAPDGGKDENVFDIRQGVAICILVKLPPSEEGRS